MGECIGRQVDGWMDDRDVERTNRQYIGVDTQVGDRRNAQIGGRYTDAHVHRG